MTTATEKQARIMIWSTPRSISTAFARSMSARGDTEVFWEPYLACYSFGPERKKHWGDKMPEMMNAKYTYSYIDKLLNADYPNSTVLFVKGMVEGIRGKFDVVDSTYRHSFLVRRPDKMFRSLERLSREVPGKTQEFINDFKDIYHDLEAFYNHVQIKFGQTSPPIIDADDLVSYPETILPKYCEVMGIEFTPKMLQWDSVDPSQLNWHCSDVGEISHPETKNTVVLMNAMQGLGFGKAPDLVTIEHYKPSPIVMEFAEHAMPVYQRFYERRIRP
ncbi:uncharacterized protein [Diadema antillarum]|uniref:uncharacterized protein n=1 Tax=Diadema antillarum TaxID=105358 RepID=UPI003A87DB49